jgi:integrase
MNAKTHIKTTLANTEAKPSAGRAKLATQNRSLIPSIIRCMESGTELADPDHPGLRVRAVGEQRIFFYRYKNPAGALRQIEIGVLGAMTLTTIRNEWQALRDKVRSGADPREEMKARRLLAMEEQKAAKQAEREQTLTVGKVIDRYLEEKIDRTRKPKGAAETRRMLNQLIQFATWTEERRKVETPKGRVRPKLPKGVKDVAGLAAKDFTRDMAHDLLLAFGHTAPRSGGMARAELRGAWRYGIAAGFLPSPSPFEKVIGSKTDDFGGGALVGHSERERALNSAEVGHLLRWMAEPGTYSRTVRDALELVLRTGLRSGEVCGIHSRELARRDGVLWLDIPAERMKGKKGKQKPHSVPLVGRAELLVLARMPETSGYLFPSKDPAKPILQKVLGVDVYACSGRSKAVAYKQRKVCPVGNWAPHDLRRTARSLLSELGCPFEIGEAILAHRLPGVSAVYARAGFEEAKIDWLTKLGSYLDKLQIAHLNLSVVNQA